MVLTFLHSAGFGKVVACSPMVFHNNDGTVRQQGQKKGLERHSVLAMKEDCCTTKNCRCGFWRCCAGLLVQSISRI